MNNNQRCLLFAGALHLDELATVSAEKAVLHASNPVHWTYTVGGVATNAAVSANLINGSERPIGLVAAIGSDTSATALMAALQPTGLHLHLQAMEQASTGRYCAIVDKQGELLLGLADVDLAEQLSGKHVAQLIHTLQPEAMLMDTNLSENCLCAISEACVVENICLAAMAVSPIKAMKLVSLPQPLPLLFCNRLEATAITGLLNESGKSKNTAPGDQPPIDELADGLQHAGFTQFVLTDGQNDLLVQSLESRETLSVPDIEIAHSVNGAGDALAGASFAAFTQGMPLLQAVQRFGLPQAIRVITGQLQALPLYPH